MKEKSEIKNSIIAGAISGAITSVTFQPLEFIKTRLQQPNREKNQTVKTIIRATLSGDNQKLNLFNLSKLWSGLTPSLIRSVPVAAIYYALIETFKNTPRLGNSNMVNSFLIGATARTIADVITFPLALIKTRFESDVYHYNGTTNAFKSIMKIEGIKGLYKGLSATLLRDMSYSGVSFTIYTETKRLAAIHISNSSSNHTVFIASCALFSSIIACTTTQPPDVIRSFMQLDPVKHNRLSSTMKFIHENHGLGAFFRGLVPRLARRTLISVMGWTIYEKMTLKT